jgi:preprotein translocase subunit SecE
MVNPTTYLLEVKEELQKVTWPSRQQTISMTGLVIGVSVAVGMYIGGLDFLFSRLMALLLQ